MTLAEMADFICGKVNQRETEDVAACKTFLKRRHDMIWIEELWKDSLVEYRQTLSADADDYTPASNYLPSKGVLLLPPIIHRVVAARTSVRKLNILRPEYFYRIDFDAFAKTGEPADYVLLPPCVWEWETAQPVLAEREDGDAENSLAADLLDSDGVGITRATKTLDEDFKLIGETERIDAIVTTTGFADTVTVGAPGETILANASFGTVHFYFSDEEITDVTGLTPAASVGTLSTSDPVTPGAYIALSVSGTGAPDFAEAVPDNFGGQITYNGGGLVYAASTPRGVSILAGETNAKRRQRIRLVEIPTAEVTIRVLGKRFAPTFSLDTDEPGISGMENCLIAFGLADMLERDESYPEAQAKVTEAMELLKQLKRLEVAQQAHHCRIIPEGGYGDDYFETPHGFNF